MNTEQQELVDEYWRKVNEILDSSWPFNLFRNPPKKPMFAPWYQEILDSEEKTRKRLKWLQDCLACEGHKKNSHGFTTRHGFGYSKCKCGATKWDTDRFWQDMPRDDREKMENEVGELTELLANKSGSYEI